MDQDCLSFLVIKRSEIRQNSVHCEKLKISGLNCSKKSSVTVQKKRPISKEYCQSWKYTFGPLAKFGM